MRRSGGNTALSFFNLGYFMTQRYDAILNARSTSSWLVNALRSALERDPTDALSDAEILVLILQDNNNHALVEAMFASATLADDDIEFLP